MSFQKKFKRQPEITEVESPQDEIEEEEFDNEDELDVPIPQAMRKQPSTSLAKSLGAIKEEVKGVPQWTVEEVTTATTPVIYDSKNKKAYSLYEAIAELLNRTQE